MQERKALLKGPWKLVLAMLIFASIGIFVRKIPLTTLELVFYRVLIGTVSILAVMLVLRQKPFQCKKKSLLLAAISGVVLAVNWILFFQALRYTTVAIGTLTYYLAPVLVIFLAPAVLHETLSRKQMGCALLAPLGLSLVVAGSGFGFLNSSRQGLGIICGLGSAIFYALLIMLNKKLDDIDNLDRTLIQLLSAALVLSPVLLWRHDLSLVRQNLLPLMTVGVIHTGLAYYLYLSGLKETPTQVTAVLSYADPVFSVVFAAVFLGEGLLPVQIAGAGIVLWSAYLCTRPGKNPE